MGISGAIGRCALAGAPGLEETAWRRFIAGVALSLAGAQFTRTERCLINIQLTAADPAGRRASLQPGRPVADEGAGPDVVSGPAGCAPIVRRALGSTTQGLNAVVLPIQVDPSSAASRGSDELLYARSSDAQITRH